MAERADVAVSTVSRYLNGGYVSEALRARIAAVVSESGFTPSATARNLSIGRRGSIGVVVESSRGPWFMQLLAGIEEELARSHTTLMLASLALRGRYDPDVVNAWIRERRVDGLIFARLTKTERPLLRAALAAHLPLVAVAPDEPLGRGHAVRCDNEDAGQQAARHLLELGHRRVGFAGGPEDSLDTQDRLLGLRNGLQAQGVRLRAADVGFCGSYEAEAGEAFATRFLARASRPTALVLGNDALALSFMRAALQAGLGIPGQLSVVGFDGIPEGARCWPGLTTVRQPMREMGRMACENLRREIEDPEEGAASTVTYRMDLLVRESSGPPPR